MVEYKKYTLDNGLHVTLHRDDSSPLVVINLLYNVGSKHESPDKTGLTHLFEHLMFSGTPNIPDFDDVVQKGGGENNAFTNNDFTNFYSVFPKSNLETGLWLEADRMAHMVIRKKPLEIQKKVVIEEFKETCLNEPYGDMWHHLGDMLYPDHPYNWPVIGKEFSHIDNVTLNDAAHFFNTFYNPDNAYLSISGDIHYEDTIQLIDKYFSGIQNKQSKISLSTIDYKTSSNEKSKTVTAAVPAKTIILAYKMSHRIHQDYYVTDLISDVLAGGRSSWLYQKLVKEQQLFSSIDAYITGTTDAGALLIDGKINPEISVEKARNAIHDLLYDLRTNPIDDEELQKLKNKSESNLVFSESSIMGKAMSLGYYDYLGNTDLINDEINYYYKITSNDIMTVSKNIFTPENEVELIYLPDLS
jgi:zinc protease